MISEGEVPFQGLHQVVQRDRSVRLQLLQNRPSRVCIHSEC